MAANILDLTAEIVGAHASVTELSPDELLKEIKDVYAMLEALDQGGQLSATGITLGGQGMTGEGEAAGTPVPAMSLEEAFKPDQVACMICGKKGMKTLKRHIGSAHNMKPGQYRKQFNIPRDQPLSAIEYVEKRRQAALDKGLGEKLVAAREARKKKARKARK